MRQATMNYAHESAKADVALPEDDVRAACYASASNVTTFMMKDVRFLQTVLRDDDFCRHPISQSGSCCLGPTQQRWRLRELAWCDVVSGTGVQDPPTVRFAPFL